MNTIDEWVLDFAEVVNSYLKWKEENKHETGLNEREKQSLIEKHLSKLDLSDNKEASQIKKALQEFNFNSITNPPPIEEDDTDEMCKDYIFIDSFCSFGFYDRESEILFSLGKFSKESNLDSIDFMVHSKMGLNDLYKIMINGMGWEFIKSERDVDVNEYYEFTQETDLRDKLETMKIKYIEYLIEKLKKIN